MGPRRQPAALLILAAAAVVFSVEAIAGGVSIKLATWNLEWFTTPDTFASLRDHCTTNDEERRLARRQFPCDVARKLERSASDYAALRRYAAQLNAEVIALEETDGPDAARQLFRDHDFCFTSSKALQNNGFAIRRGIPFRCAADLQELSLGDAVRRGAVVVLYPGTAHELHLLGVHLKSGCPRQALDASTTSCRQLARQLPVLQAWIESQVRAGHRFAVLGDFNRDLLREKTVEDRQKKTNLLDALAGSISGPALYSAAGAEDFRSCARGQRNSGFIDYILLSDSLRRQQVPHSVERIVWSDEDAAHRILSDHCPVAVRIIP
jgi:endonuclease/exonuclease/phosphatase family metal-dependent hydrolase